MNPSRALAASDSIASAFVVTKETTKTTKTTTETTKSASVHLNAGAKRRHYSCSQCGKPKVGHVCTARPARLEPVNALAEPVWAADPAAIAASDATFAAHLEHMERLPPPSSAPVQRSTCRRKLVTISRSGRTVRARSRD